MHKKISVQIFKLLPVYITFSELFIYVDWYTFYA